jgi:hypothetical protein
MTVYELSECRKSLSIGLTEASRAANISRTRLWYAERGAARLSDAEREALEKLYTSKAEERVTRLSQVFGAADSREGV